MDEVGVFRYFSCFFDYAGTVGADIGYDFCYVEVSALFSCCRIFSFCSLLAFQSKKQATLSITSAISHTHCVLPALYKASKKCPTKILTLQMVTALFVEMLDNFQHSTWLIPERLKFYTELQVSNLRATIMFKSLLF
jgi:hypothetical protein